jgi:hypothetical protein
MEIINLRRIRIIEGNAKSLRLKSNLKKDFGAAIYFSGCLQQHGSLKQQRCPQQQGHRQQQGRQKKIYKAGTNSSKNIDNSRVDRNSK